MGVTLYGNTFSGNILINNHIVEEDLVLFFDPNNDESYAGSGTTVFNIAPEQTNNGISGSLDDENMYVEGANNRNSYFRVRSDSVVERLDFSGTIIRPSTGSSTVMFYFWSDYDPEGQYAKSQAFFGGKYTNYMALRYTSSALGNYQPEAETNGQGALPDNNHDYFARPGNDFEGNIFTTASWQSWTSVIHNETGSNWFNGNPGVGREATNEYHLHSDTSTHSFNRLGSTSTGTNSEARGGDIRMGALLIYSRALTEDEIRQNLDVLDRRFRD